MQDGKFVILCIDDDQDVLDVLRLILESAGYVMMEAPSAARGLQAFKEHNPDLIIVDLMMEEVDAGRNLVTQVKALGSAVPIFMLSSVGDQLSMSTSYTELGLSGVFQKPINPDLLLATLKAKLKKK